MLRRMNEKINQLLSQMAALEDELRTAVHQQESRVFFQIKGKRVELEKATRDVRRKIKTGVLRWLVRDRPQNLLTGPLIYGIARVRRSDYLVFDRRHLAYLNAIEKFHCTYCEYGNGLMACMTEILARTEQYFCPIKHAHKILGTHTRYNRFLDYGEAGAYEAKLEEYRVALGKEK
jgi:hypothetical protein